LAGGTVLIRAAAGTKIAFRGVLTRKLELPGAQLAGPPTPPAGESGSTR
jgi:hypothetical protein